MNPVQAVDAALEPAWCPECDGAGILTEIRAVWTGHRMTDGFEPNHLERPCAACVGSGLLDTDHLEDPNMTTPLSQRLTDTNAVVKAAHEAHYRAALELTQARRVLAACEAEYIRVGVEGKNEAARQAALDALTVAERFSVQAAEDEKARTSLVLTLAQLDHQLARDLLTLTTKAGGAE